MWIILYASAAYDVQGRFVYSFNGTKVLELPFINSTWAGPAAPNIIAGIHTAAASFAVNDALDIYFGGNKVSIPHWDCLAFADKMEVMIDRCVGAGVGLLQCKALQIYSSRASIH